jgi:hypothetical protein
MSEPSHSESGQDDAWRCGRCGDEIERGYALDAVVHPNTGSVCEDCLKPGDEVVVP